MNEDHKDAAPRSGDRQIPQVGEVLCGVYRLDRLLGWGAVGIVYAAWHLELRRPCAIKILHPNFVDNTDVRERFRREALSAFKLQHPYIIQILDFREDESGWPLIVMELLHGESLRQRLSRGALSLAHTERFYMQICEAMGAAHRRGVVHRDLKPENIFVARAAQPGGGEEEVAKILDFGISKVADHPEITATHVLLGSPSYMSPEQARGDARTVDGRADIFSLGVILFECLTGRKAFSTTDAEQKRLLIMGGAVPSLRMVAPELPPALDEVVRHACAVAPEQRYQSAAELCAALRQALRPDPEATVLAPALSESLREAAPAPLRTPSSEEPTVALDPASRPIPPPRPEVPRAPAEAVTLRPPLDPSARGPAHQGPDRFTEGLARRLAPWPAAQHFVWCARRWSRGKELLLLAPFLFLFLLLVLLLVDMQRSGSAPDGDTVIRSRRLEVIDGQKGSR